MFVTDKLPPTVPLETLASPRVSRHELAAQPKPADDGTHALLKAGFWIVLVGVLALVATKTIFGGIGIYGAHTNAGWLSLMCAMMSIPFGLMLLLLGGAKWLRNRHGNR